MKKKKIVLIVGFGSIGKRHADILSKTREIKKIYILTKQKIKRFKSITSLQEARKLTLDYVIISSETNNHYMNLKFFEKNFKNIKILVEKPLFNKLKYLKVKNNEVYLGYNMRFHPFMKIIRKNIKNKKIWFINTFCGSFLPLWRKNIDYSKSYSSQKKKGGGVILDLSHELDYLTWIFGKINPRNFIKKKLSDLKIDTEDFFSLNSFIKKINLQLDLNFITQENIRRLIIAGKNFSMNVDFVNHNMSYNYKNKKINFKYSKLERNYTYKEMHKNILSENENKIACSYQEGFNLMKLIEKLKK